MSPLIILALFLAGTLWMDMKYKKDSNSIMEYTIDHKMFTTAALIATVLATDCGSVGRSSVFARSIVYHVWGWAAILASLACIMIASRMGIFIKNHISIADTLGYIYERLPRIIIALATVGTSDINIAIQVTTTSWA